MNLIKISVRKLKCRHLSSFFLCHQNTKAPNPTKTNIHTPLVEFGVLVFWWLFYFTPSQEF